MSKNKKEGSGLLVVLIIATAIGFGVYSTLKLVQGEFRLNKKASIFHEAKQAAESILQASMADLQNRGESQTAFPLDTLAPTRNPLSISDEFIGIHNASDSLSYLVIPTVSKYTSTSDFGSEETEVIGGQIPPGDWEYIDPRIPGNESDPLKGTRVYQRSIEMISKATVDRPNVGKATVYARQFLQIRDAPLFAYAIFYNLPLEIAPGAKMDIYGGSGIHGNDGGWFQSNSGLDIHTKLTLAGNLYHGRHPDSGKSNSNGSVRIVNGSGDLVSLLENGSWPSDSASDFDGTWLVSGEDNYLDISKQVFDDNLQTKEHGILTQNPVGVSDYIEDIDNDKSNGKQSSNSAYNLIQPVVDKSQLAIPNEADDPVAYTKAKKFNEIEEQKYAYKAGLTIEVQSDGSLQYYTYQREGGEKDGKLTYDGSGNPVKTPLEPAEPIATYKPFTEVDGEITSGFHDKRVGADLDVIEVDVSQLTKLLHADDDAKDRFGSSDDQQPSSWWNGVVYVEFPQQNATSNRDDYVNPAAITNSRGATWGGVKLKNGGMIPNPEFAINEGNSGMSFATNQMLYVEGNYNADGDFDTGDPVTPDDAGEFNKVGEEAPAALIADSITFLSNNWDDKNSTKSQGNRTAKNTEVSAAILTGLVPSGETGSNSYSGGVENFPRFLEKWSGKTIRIRGSTVALFESEVGTERWGKGDVYSAPNRAWGFHSKFGENYLPPGTPNTRRYRGTDFQLITRTEYLEHLNRIKTYF